MRDRLYRSRTDRVFAGVCGGLAEHLDVDPSLVRIAWVVLALSTAVVPFLVLYIVVALIVPERPAGEVAGPSAEGASAGGPGLSPTSAPPARAARGDWAVLLGAVLVVVGLAFLLERWFWIRIEWSLLWPLVLVAIGVLLIVLSWRRPGG